MVLNGDNTMRIWKSKNLFSIFNLGLHLLSWAVVALERNNIDKIYGNNATDVSYDDCLEE